MKTSYTYAKARCLVLNITGKRKILYLIFFLIIKQPFFLHSQSSTVSFSLTPYSDPDFIAPGRGTEHWYDTPWDDAQAVRVPAGNSKGLDEYYRFTWRDFETTVQGGYSWTKFDRKMNAAIAAGKKFSFGVMPLDGSVYQAPMVAGAYLTYPDYLHTQMQNETNKDWITNGMWIPNWNSTYYLTALKNLNVAINNHINTGTYNGVLYKNVVGYIDVRGYGDFGEWHTYPFTSVTPSGRAATAATLKAIIDAHTSAFPDHPLVCMIAGFQSWGDANTPAEVINYLLTAKNAWGPLGWRRDNWGNSEPDNILVNNPSSFNGVKASTLIMDRWKTSPIVGEPWNGHAGVSNNGAECPHYDLERQIRLYHATSFGNGNYQNLSSECTKDNIRNASKASGYRLILDGGSLSSTIVTGIPFSVMLQWKNIGIAPTYENWDVVYELKNESNVTVWSGKSSFSPKLFLPQTLATSVTDNFTLPAIIASGSYKLNVVIKDPNGYRAPLPLAISGRNADGSYTLKNVLVTPAADPQNIAPVANAGSNKTITLPTNSTTLTGSGSSDPDGTIASYQWQQISGPSVSTLSAVSAANITVSALQAGVYTYRLTVTDNSNATATATVTVTVNAAVVINQAPVANAGSNKTITLPTNSTTLTGSGSSDPDGTIASYQWQQISGPSVSTLSAVSAANITVSALQAGVYTYRLTVTDNSNATATATVTVTVNAAVVINQAPVANAGSNKTITLPTNSTTLTGSGSSDPDGTIASYQWQQISGPSVSTLSAVSAANITVSALQAGVYTYRLTVTDNSNATATATVTVTVNAAVVINQAPVANAGSNKTITLPTNSTTLTGSGSSDPDGTIASYQWQQISGPSVSTLSAVSAANITVSALQAGVYTYRLTVTDNSNATATATVTVTVNAAVVINQAPVANAGSNKTITLPTNSTTLTGSGSSDPDGTIASYQWQQISGPSVSTLSAVSAANITVSALQAGVYTYRLTVTDNSNATATATVTVTVNAAVVINQAPVANAGADQILAMPTNSAILNAEKSTDPDGTIISYQWLQISGPSNTVFSSKTEKKVTISNLLAGEYIYKLTVKDNYNATASDTIRVAVADNFRNYTKGFTLYPNPAQDVINLRLLSETAGKTQIDIFDIKGAKVISSISVNKPAGALTVPVTVSQLNPGTYVISVTTVGYKRISSNFLKL